MKGMSFIENVHKIKFGQWQFFVNTKIVNLSEAKCGKWMYFFDTNGLDFADKICNKAVEEGVCCESKHTLKQFVDLQGSGVCCFYCNGYSIDDHKNIISFFLKNDMIKKTKSGAYTNISFKFDEQTQSNEYKDKFTAKISLSDFIDLYTGEWKTEIKLDNQNK